MCPAGSLQHQPEMQCSRKENSGASMDSSPENGHTDVDSPFSRENSPSPIALAIHTAGVVDWDISKGKVWPKQDFFKAELSCLWSKPGLLSKCAHLDGSHVSSLKPPQGWSQQTVWPGPEIDTKAVKPIRKLKIPLKLLSDVFIWVCACVIVSFYPRESKFHLFSSFIFILVYLLIWENHSWDEVIFFWMVLPCKKPFDFFLEELSWTGVKFFIPSL